MARDRFLVWVALCTSAVFSAPGDSDAHQGDIIYPMYELPSSELPDLHDGTLEDWEAVLPNASLNHNDFIWTANRLSSIDVADMAFRVFLAWHSSSQRIYIGFEGIDDEYQPLEEGNAGNGYITVMVDGDHSGGQYFYFEADGYSQEESRRLFGSQAQSYRIQPQTLDGRHLFLASWAEWAQQPPWADVGALEYGEAPTRSIVEFALTPWDDLNVAGPEASQRSILEAGQIIGLNISVVDFDVQNAPDGFFYLGRIASRAQVADGSFSHSGFAENAVDVELISCDRDDCGSAPRDTSVERDSWGRIKAALR